MDKFYQKNSYVAWKWGQGKAQGKIKEIYHESVTKKIKNQEILRHGTKDNPAYFIEQKNGNKVLKLHSELIKHKHSEDQSYSTEDNKHFVPTAQISKIAKKGLDLREKFGRGATDVGVKRANQLIEREFLTVKDIKSMYSYFARHTVDKKAKNFGDDENPSKGYIAWLIWGGDSAYAWVKKIHDKL